MENHKEHTIDEFLEALYKAGEDGRLPVDMNSLKLINPPDESELESLVKRGMIKSGNSVFDLTSSGQTAAELLVRRHRLAERLFSEILELDESGLHTTSCSFEHVLDPAVTESVCAILGHPPTCPHGKRIPPGDCCRGVRRKVSPIVIPLVEFPAGKEAKIVFITTPHHQRLARLVNLGVVPGGRFMLMQKKPSYLLRLGSTEVAIDDSIASEIFVRQI